VAGKPATVPARGHQNLTLSASVAERPGAMLA